MPAGCFFTCKNQKCEGFDKKMTMIGPWPLGKIEEILEKEDTDDEARLNQLKEEGREFFCIAFPNDENLPMYGWRVQKWCSRCNCMWDYDITMENEDQEFVEAYEKADLPTKCPKCEKQLKDYRKALDAGMECPLCAEEMGQERWFANENPVIKER